MRKPVNILCVERSPDQAMDKAVAILRRRGHKVDWVIPEEFLADVTPVDLADMGKEFGIIVVGARCYGKNAFGALLVKAVRDIFGREPCLLFPVAGNCRTERIVDQVDAAILKGGRV